MYEYKIKIKDGVKVPKEMKKHLTWAVCDILMCSEQFIEISWET